MDYLFWLSEFEKPRPDKDKDLRGWSQSWERDLSKHYDADIIASTKSQLTVDRNFQIGMQINMQEFLFRSERKLGEICKLQRKIRFTALPYLATEGLEESWRSLTADSREEHVLKALCIVSSISADMEGYRKWCPEMTVSNFCKNEGQLFIELLKIIITDDPDATNIPVVNLPNSKIDWILGNSSLRTIKSRLIMDRTYFISFVTWRILLPLSDSPNEEYIIGKPPQALDGHIVKKAITEIPEPVDGKKTLNLMKKASKDYKASHTSQVDICWSCEKDVAHLPPGTVLKACVKCKELGRIVRYCSRECQKNDWKWGIPRPHKTICGKLLAEGDDSQAVRSESNESSEPQNPLIPDPDPGFKRSPALLYQISELRDDKVKDYMVFQSGDLPNFWFALPHSRSAAYLQMRLGFLIFRRRAFRNGDRAAVHAMFQVIGTGPMKSHVSTSHIAKQLEREYGFPLPDHVELKPHQDLEDFTNEEKDWIEKAFFAVHGQHVSFQIGSVS